MTDLLRTVKQRYSKGLSFNNMFSLSFRQQNRRNEQREQFAHEQLERRTLQTANRDMLRHAKQWEQKVVQLELRRKDDERRSQKKTEQLISQIEKKITDLQRSLEKQIAESGKKIQSELQTQLKRQAREDRKRKHAERQYLRRRGE